MFFRQKSIYISLMVSVIFFSFQPSYALRLDEAISLAKENLPSYRASAIKIKSNSELYNASLSPYLPMLDASASNGRIFTSSEEFTTKSYDFTLSYTLFDWGNRKANRDIAKLNLDISQEDLTKNSLDLEFSVKSAFYTVTLLKDAVEQRKIQIKDAEKDYEVADGRYKFGVTKLSDVLQASVRLEQARFNLIQTEGNLKKALSELNSLIGRPLDTMYDLQGTFDLEVAIPDISKLSQAALQRPEIKQAENSVKIAENNKSIIRSTFFPLFSVNASYVKTGGDIIGAFFEEEKTIDKNIALNHYMKQKLERFDRLKNVKSTRILGMIAVVELSDIDKEKRVGLQISQYALSRGVLLRPLGNTIYVMPPFVITNDELDTIFDVIYDAVNKLEFTFK